MSNDPLMNNMQNMLNALTGIHPALPSKADHTIRPLTHTPPPARSMVAVCEIADEAASRVTHQWIDEEQACIGGKGYRDIKMPEAEQDYIDIDITDAILDDIDEAGEGSHVSACEEDAPEVLAIVKESEMYITDRDGNAIIGARVWVRFNTIEVEQHD